MSTRLFLLCHIHNSGYTQFSCIHNSRCSQSRYTKTVTQVYCGGPKCRLPQWLRVNYEAITTTTKSLVIPFITSSEINSEQCLSNPNYHWGWAGHLLLPFPTSMSCVVKQGNQPIGMQYQGKNPNEVMCLVCQHCLTSQLQAGHTAGLADKIWKSRGIWDGIIHLIFTKAFYTCVEHRNVQYVHGYEKGTFDPSCHPLNFCSLNYCPLNFHLFNFHLLNFSTSWNSSHSTSTLSSNHSSNFLPTSRYCLLNCYDDK